MLRDKEGNTLTLSKQPNPHLMVLGKSGQGKTYFCNRYIEEEYCRGKRICIIDYSDSYTQKELYQNSFFIKDIKVLNPCEEKVLWKFFCSGKQMFIEEIKDILTEMLGITGHYQKTLLKKVCEKCLEDSKEISMEILNTCLEKMYRDTAEQTTNKETLKHMESLSDRLGLFAGISQIVLTYDSIENVYVSSKELTILQLSDFPDQQRKFLTNFMLGVIWRESRKLKERHRFDIVVLDEFQNIPLEEGSTLTTILREGRKYDFSVILSSQFISGYKTDKINTLQQAGNMLLFHPTDRDLKCIADIIDYSKNGQWKHILQKLDIGEAVLKGKYSMNHSSRMIDTPIVCTIESSNH